jgi:hypothetical protein
MHYCICRQIAQYSLINRLKPIHLSKKYHPQTNELTEKINQCLEMYLRYMVHKTLPSSGGNGLSWLKSIQNNIWV